MDLLNVRAGPSDHLGYIGFAAWWGCLEYSTTHMSSLVWFLIKDMHVGILTSTVLNPVKRASTLWKSSLAGPQKWVKDACEGVGQRFYLKDVAWKGYCILLVHFFEKSCMQQFWDFGVLLTHAVPIARHRGSSIYIVWREVLLQTDERLSSRCLEVYKPQSQARISIIFNCVRLLRPSLINARHVLGFGVWNDLI